MWLVKAHTSQETPSSISGCSSLRKQADWEINDEEYLEDITTELKEEIEENLNKTLLSFLKKHNLKSKNYFVKNVIKHYFNENGILIKKEEISD